jgi:hypothetical protein
MLPRSSAATEPDWPSAKGDRDATSALSSSTALTPDGASGRGSRAGGGRGSDGIESVSVAGAAPDRILPWLFRPLPLRGVYG